jgi:hypothetical protein
MTGIEVLTHLRTEIEDWAISGQQSFTYETSSIFFLQEGNIETSTLRVYKNGVLLTTEYSYDSSESSVTITAVLNEGDDITTSYEYYSNYSDSILMRYVQRAIGDMSIYAKNNLIFSTISNTLFEILEADESNTPEITDAKYNLIIAISALRIKPNWSGYRTSEVGISFPEKMNREQKIKSLIDGFTRDLIGDFEEIEQDNLEAE